LLYQAHAELVKVGHSCTQISEEQHLSLHKLY